MPIRVPSKNMNLLAAPLSTSSSFCQSAEIEKTSQKDKVKTSDPSIDKKEKKKVTFFGEVRVTETISRDEYTGEELESVWYSKIEYAMIKASFTTTIQMISKGTYMGDSDEETTRGLEYRHRKGAIKRQRNKLNALYAVLDEQQRQWNEGYENAEELATVYIQINKHCQKAAHELGLDDEKVSRSIHREKDNNDDNKSENNNKEEKEVNRYQMDHKRKRLNRLKRIIRRLTKKDQQQT